KLRTSASTLPMRRLAASCRLASMVALVVATATSMATPSATARRVRSVRSGLEAKLRQASNERPGTMILPTAEVDVLDQQPVTHQQHAVGVGGRARVVCHQHDSLLELARAGLEQMQDLFAGGV